MSVVSFLQKKNVRTSKCLMQDTWQFLTYLIANIWDTAISVDISKKIAIDEKPGIPLDDIKHEGIHKLLIRSNFSELYELIFCCISYHSQLLDQICEKILRLKYYC